MSYVSTSICDSTLDSSTGATMATPTSDMDIYSPQSTASLPPISPPSPPERGLETSSPPGVSDYGISPSPPAASSPIPPPPPENLFEDLPALASRSSSSVPPPSRSSSGSREVVLRFAENHDTPSPAASVGKYVDELVALRDQVEAHDCMERTPPGVTVITKDYLDKEEVTIKITFDENIYKGWSKWSLEDIMNPGQLAQLDCHRIKVPNLSSIFLPSWDRRLLKSSFLQTYKPALEASLATSSNLVIWLENTETMNWRKLKRQADEADGFVWLSLPRVTDSGMRHLRPLRCVAEVGPLHNENGLKNKTWLTQSHPKNIKYALAKTMQRRNMMSTLSQQQEGWLFCHGMRSENLWMSDGTLAHALYIDHKLVDKYHGNIASLLNYTRSETEPEEYKRLLTTRPALHAVQDEDIELVGEVQGFDRRAKLSLQEDQEDVNFNTNDEEDSVI